MATAGYIALGTDTAASINRVFNTYMPKTSRILRSLVPGSQAKSTENPDQAEPQGSQDKRDQDTSELLLKEARAAAAAGRIEESRGLLHRILDKDPSNQSAIAALKEVESASTGNRSSATDRNLEQSVSRISGLINSGKFQIAKMEIDRLQQVYPNSSEIAGLRKRLDALNSKQVQEQTRKEEEQQRMKEDEWNRQISDSLGRGKYNEAAGALTLWLSENPGSPRAAELNAKIQEIQRHLKAYAQAMTESRYSDAYNALSGAERLNPADPNIAELRRQTDSRKAAARAVLTVHRLGAKAALLLDGKPIGKDGEVENESIPIGSHTLAIENSGGAVAFKVQEYAEGQHVAWVYDLLKQTLRPMVESDRESLTRRKAMEEVSRFPLEHDHGVFRGSCRGVLSLDTLDVAYSPSAGSHGFRIPFKLLKLKAEGKSVSMYYISDNNHFQTFKFQDPQAAGKFVQKWDELKTYIK
jgi:tetratricopeptide (TPR) repeat protein